MNTWLNKLAGFGKQHAMRGGGAGGVAEAPSASALPALLELLEKRYGRLSDLFEPASVGVRVEKGSELTTEGVEELVNHKACAVVVRGFYPPSACPLMVQQLLSQHGAIQNWQVKAPSGYQDSDVYTVGTPFNMVCRRGEGESEASAKERMDAYFRSVLPLMRKLREPPKGPAGPADSNSESESQSDPSLPSPPPPPPPPSTISAAAAPLLSPLDKLRLELDEVWAGGATLTKNAEGKPFLAGTARIMHGPTCSAEGAMHVDDLAPLKRGEGLFSANIYLQVPPTGGELAIWPVTFASRWDFYRHASTLSLLTNMHDEEGQRLLRQRFPAPYVVKVEPGDLVLLCPQRPHAALGFPMGTRVSMQSFLSLDPPARDGRPQPFKLDV